MRSRVRIITTANLRPAMGAVFRPGGVHAFLISPTDAFCNKNVPLDLIWGLMAGTLRERLRTESHLARKFQLLEIALLGRIKERVRLNPAVQYALEEFKCACI